MTVGEKIRKRRKELNMTMEDLGRAIGVQRSAINKYEKDMIKDMKESTIRALAKALQVSPIYLLDDLITDPNEVSLKRLEVNRENKLPPGMEIVRIGNKPVMKKKTKTRSLLFDDEGNDLTLYDPPGSNKYEETLLRITTEIDEKIGGVPRGNVVKVETDPELNKMLKIWDVSTPKAKKAAMEVLRVMSDIDK